MKNIRSYIELMRLHRPIGIFLLLWPTWWALWLSSKGHPSIKNIFIFTLGVILMRSAGCVINDIADQKFDIHVRRTMQRPLATGELHTQQAITLFLILCILAFSLVLFLNPLTIALSFIGLALASIYPFSKRITHLPQVVLGAAFAWAIPMVFSATLGKLPLTALPLYFAALLWPLAYDTFYAMADKEDDEKIGIKSSAILFGSNLKIIVAAIYALFFVNLILTGILFHLSPLYYFGLILAAISVGFQFWKIRDNIPKHYFQAFLQNNYTGLIIFFGILASDYL